MHSIEFSIAGVMTFANPDIINVSEIGTSFSPTDPIASSSGVSFSVHRYDRNNGEDLWSKYFRRISERDAPAMAYLNRTLHKDTMSLVLNNNIVFTKATAFVHCGTEVIELSSTYGTLAAGVTYTIAARGAYDTIAQPHYVSDYKLDMAAITEFPTYWKGRPVRIRLDNQVWYRGFLSASPVLDAENETILFNMVLLENILSGEFGRGHELKSTTLTPVSILPDDSLVGYFSARSTNLDLNFVQFDSHLMQGTNLQRVTFTADTSASPTNKQYARNISAIADDYATTTANLFGLCQYPIAPGAYTTYETQECVVNFAYPSSGNTGFTVQVTCDSINTACPTIGNMSITIYPVVGMGLTDVSGLTTNVQLTLANSLCTVAYTSSGSGGINSNLQISSGDVPVAHLAKASQLEGGILQIKACTPYTKWQDKFVGIYSRYNRKDYSDSVNQRNGETSKDFNKRKDVKQRVLNYAGDKNKNFQSYAWGHLFGYGEDDTGAFLGYPIRCITDLTSQRDFEDEEISYGEETVKMYGLRVPSQWMEQENNLSTQVRYLEVVIAKSFWQQGMAVIFLADDYATYDIQSDEHGYGYQTFDIEYEDYDEGVIHAIADICRFPSADRTIDGITYYAYSIKNARQTLVQQNGSWVDSYKTMSGTKFVPLYGFGSWPQKSDCKLTISPLIKFKKLSDLLYTMLVSCEGANTIAYDILPCGYNLAGFVDGGSFATVDSPVENFILSYNELTLDDLLSDCLRLSLSALVGAHSDSDYKIKAVPILDPAVNSGYTVTDNQLLEPISVTVNDEVYTEYTVTYQGNVYNAIDKNAECMFGAGSTLDIDLSHIDSGIDTTKMNWSDAQQWDGLFNEMFRALALVYGYPRQTVQFAVPLDVAAWWNLGDAVTVTTSYGETPYGQSGSTTGRITSIAHNVLAGVTNVTMTRSVQQYAGWNISLNVIFSPTEYMQLEYGANGGLRTAVNRMILDQRIYIAMLGYPSVYRERYQKNFDRNDFALKLMAIKGGASGIIEFEGYPVYIRCTLLAGSQTLGVTLGGTITVVGDINTLPDFTDVDNLVNMRVILDNYLVAPSPAGDLLFRSDRDLLLA